MNNNLYNSDGLYRGLFSQKPDPKPLTKQSMQEQQISQDHQEYLPEPQILKVVSQRLLDFLHFLMLKCSLVMLLVVKLWYRFRGK
jgi:hypothetical protein